MLVSRCRNFQVIDHQDNYVPLEEVSEAGAAGRAAIPFLPVLVAALVLVALAVLVELVLATFRQQPYLQVPGVVADLAG